MTSYPMRVLVTGAFGQVGWATAQRLAFDTTVIATDRVSLDLSKPDGIAAILDHIEPDIVINAAAFTTVDRCEQEPELAKCVNAEGPGAIARWCKSQDVPFIHFSTDYVFNGHGTQPWSEDDRPEPLSVYGASKLAGEERIRAAGGCFLIIRTSWLYASRGTNFLRRIFELAKSRSELRIVADQVGAPTPASLIAEALAAILANGLDVFRLRANEASGTIHLAASGEASWYEFANHLVHGLKLRGVALAVERITPIRTHEYPLPAQRPLNSRLNLERLRRVFGIEPAHWKSVLDPVLDQLARDLKDETQT